MRIRTYLLVGILGICCFAGAQERPSIRSSMVDRGLSMYDVEDASITGAVGALTMIAQPLRFGVEEVLGEHWTDQVSTARITLHLSNVTVRQVLDRLCTYDSRYTWAIDGDTINIFPRATLNNPAYFMNLIVPAIDFVGIKSADDSLAPLARVFPNLQIGYMQAGGDPSYDRPWYTSFKNISIRGLINRVNENIMPSSSWGLRGSKDQRFFTFEKRGFRSEVTRR